MPLSYLGRMKLGDNSSFLKRQEKSSVQTQIGNAQNRLQSAGVDYSNDGSNQNFLLRALDVLSRPGYGATNVIREFTNPYAGSTPQEFDPLAAFWRGLKGQDKAQGKDIFTDLGWEGEKGIFGGEAKWYNPSVAGAAGLALDIFNPLDPVNWLAFGIGDDIVKGSAKGLDALTDAFGATKATQIADILKKGAKSVDDLGAESVGKLAKQVTNMIDDPDDLKSVVQMIQEGIVETGRNATSKLDYKAMKPLQVGLQNPLSIGNSGMAVKLPGYKASGGKMKLPILYPGKDIDMTMKSIPGSEYVTNIVSNIAQKVGSVRVGTGATLGESLGKMFSTVFVPSTVPNAVIKKDLTANNMSDLVTISRTTPDNLPLSLEELMRLNDDLANVKLDNVFDFADNMSATDLKKINKGNYLSIENLAKKVGLKGFNASEITDILSDTPFNKTITEIYDQIRVLKPTDDAKKLFTEAAKLRKVMDLMYDQIPEGLKPYFSGVLKAQMANLYPTDLATNRLGKNIVSSPLMAYEFNYKGVPVSVVVNSGEDFNLNAWARVSATLEALDELPETAIQALQGQIDISPIPIKNPDTSMTIGDTIVLGRIDKPTVAHEYGHIWDSVAGDQDSYTKAILSDAQKIDDTLTPDDLYSDYSRSLYDTDNAIGIKEDLADSVSDYIVDPKTFRELYPSRAAEIEKMIGNASISRDELAQLVTKQRKLSESVAQIPRTEAQITKMVQDIDKFAFEMSWQPGEKTYQSFRGNLNKLFEETNWKTRQWQEQVATIFKDLDEEARKQIMDAAAQITGTEIPGVVKATEPLFAEQEFPIFISKLEEAVEKMPNRMPVEDFKNYLAGKQVKKEELKWTFIDDFLEGKTHVTKAEVQQWVAGNKLDVEEIWYTRGKSEMKEIPDNIDTDDLVDPDGSWVYQDIDDMVGNVLDEWHDGSLDDYFMDDEWLEDLTAERMADTLVPNIDYGSIVRGTNRLNEEQINNLAQEAYGNFEGFFLEAPFSYEEFYPIFRDRAQQFTARQYDGIVEQNGTRMMLQYGEDTTKYSQYTQPGGEDYTELVFTLPQDYAQPKTGKVFDQQRYDEIVKRLEELENAPQQLRDTYPNRMYGEGGREAMVRDQDLAYRRELRQIREERAALVRERTALGDPPGTEISASYRSGHWDDNNVVAHTRFDTRYTEDGRKVLFIDEIQSDWHQAGRDKGYKIKLTKSEQAVIDEWRKAEQILASNFPSSPKFKQADIRVNELEEQAREMGLDLYKIVNSQRDGVPDAPFRNTWDEYVQKRLLRYAADNGYDGIAWSTGKQQADRWHQELVESIDTIQYNQEAQFLRAYKNNEEVLSRRIPKEELSETVGSDIARQLLDTTPDTFTIKPINKNPNTEGLVDRMPPDMDAVEMLRWMEQQPEYKASVPYDSIEKPTSYQVVDQNGNAWGYIYHSEEAAQKAIDDLKAVEETVKTVSGANITIGGEGMRKFYDQQMPSNFKKMGKKFGLKIEEIELDFSGNVDKFYPTEEFEDVIRYYFHGEDTGYLGRAESFVRFNMEEQGDYDSVQEFVESLTRPEAEIRFTSTQDIDHILDTSQRVADEYNETLAISDDIRRKLYNKVEEPGIELEWEDEAEEIDFWNYKQEFEAKPISKQQGIWLEPKSRQAIRQQSFPLYAKQDAQGPVDTLTAGWSDQQITALDNFLKWRNSVVKQYRQLGIPINELEKYVPFIPKRVLKGEEADVIKTVFGTGVEQATGDNFDTLMAELSKMDPNLRQRTTKATRPSEVNKLLKSDWLTEDAAVAMSLRGTRAIKAQEFSKFGDEFIAEYGLHATDITKMTGGSVPEGYMAFKVGLDQEGNKIFQQARDVIGATMQDTEVIFLPEEMVNLYNEYLGIMFNKQKKNGLVQIYDSLSRTYKKAAYLWNPGHVFRDFQGNVFNNYLMGVTDPMEYAEGLRVLRGAEGFLDTPNGQIPYRDIYEKAQKMGIVDSVMAHELPTLTGKTESGYSKVMRKATYATDGWTRTTGFIHNLKQGQSFEQAAATTKKFLFDYFDLTSFERKVMKRIIPFYTWTRKNIPLQLEVLVKNPRLFARINDVQNAIAGENIDWKEKPEYIQDMLGIQPKGSNMYVGMNLPYQDLTRVPINSNAGGDLLSSVNPMIRTPIESITNQKWWTGQELEKYPGEKTDIPVLTTLLEMLGQEQGPQIGARYGGNALSNIPILNRAGNLLDAVSGKETNDVRNLSRVSTTMGGPAVFDAASVENSADWQERQRLIDLIQLLQDEGYNIPTSGEARKEGRYRKLSRLLSK